MKTETSSTTAETAPAPKVRFTKVQRQLLEKFYMRYGCRVVSEAEKNRAVEELRGKADLSRKQIFAFCKNKKYRDRVREFGKGSRVDSFGHHSAFPGLQSSVHTDGETDIFQFPGLVSTVTIKCAHHNSMTWITTPTVFNPLSSHSCRCLPVPQGY